MLLGRQDQIEYYSYIIKLLAYSGIAGIYLLLAILITSANGTNIGIIDSIFTLMCCGLVVIYYYSKTNPLKYRLLAVLLIVFIFILSFNLGKLAAVILFNLATILSSQLITNLVDRLFSNIKYYAARINELNENLEIQVSEQTSKILPQEANYHRELQRFADIGILSAGMIHDINSPLSSVQANLELMGEQATSRHWQRIRESILQIDQIVESTRAHIQGEKQATTFNPSDIIREVSHQFSPVVLRIASERLHLAGSSVGFQRILTNLIANARDAAGSETTIQVEVFSTANLVIEISNTGKPLSVGQLGQLLTPSSSKQHHTGIGLIVTRKLLQDYFGGELCAVKPKTGFNTTIVISIPLH